MTDTSPIVDLSQINDLKARLAALEASLGNYNASSAAIAAAAASATSTTAGSTSQSVDLVNDTILKGTVPFSTPKINATKDFYVATATINYAGYTSAPVVIATAVVYDTNNVAFIAGVTINSATATQVTAKLSIPSSLASNALSAKCNWIAIGR